MNIKELDVIRAAADGVLLDVSNIAAATGIEYPTYISAAFWNNLEICRSEERLHAVLDVAALLWSAAKHRRCGSFVSHLGPTPELCPSIVSIFAHVVPSHRFGIIIFITEPEEEFDPRANWTSAGGSLYRM